MNPYIGDRQLDPDEAEQECPQCEFEFGELHFHDANKCPNCGHKFEQTDPEINEYPE